MKGSDIAVKKILVWCLMLMLLCGMAVPGQALMTSQNPLIDPQDVPHVETEDEFYNVLLCGIDFGNYSGHWASGNKRVLEICHTDVVMVASVNKTKNKLSLVSIPRDSVTYIPNVKGIYKLNAAFNCAEDVHEGMERTRDAVTWHLGGIPIHNYMAVDMASLIALVDAIGGVDFDMDMNYWGSNGRIYRKGMQHLDGVGVMDYVRARKNASKEANDVGRTNRGRAMMIAVFDQLQKVIREEGLGSVMLKMINIMFGGEYNVITDLSRGDLLTLATMLTGISGGDAIGSYTMTGGYTRAFAHWNFTFNKQDHRQQVLKEVYGIDAEPIPYVSISHATWLVERGFDAAKLIMSARKIYQECAAMENITASQQELLDEMARRYDAAVQAFDKAAGTHVYADSKAVEEACSSLRWGANRVIEAFDYKEKYSWYALALWYQDPMINEYNKINWN